MIEAYLKQYLYYKAIGERTFEQLNEAQLLKELSPDSNSIAVIVNHLSGNMLSRWTNFTSSDGEKPWRQRDREFMSVIKGREDLMVAWDKGWTCTLSAIESLKDEQLKDIVYIRNVGHTVEEAILRQLAHYAYHIGQIVILGKIFKGSEWQSLSIPKGGSKTYNQQKFAQDKRRGHFTDEYLKG